MDSFNVFQAARQLYSEFPSEAGDLECYVLAEDGEEENKMLHADTVLNCVSDILLIETCTERVANLFGVLLVDLFNRCSKEIEEDIPKHEAICRMLGSLIWSHVDAQRFAYRYFEKSPDLFMQYKDPINPPRKKIRMEEEKDEICDLRSLLIAALQLLSFDFSYFRDLWDWSILGSFVEHEDMDVKWLAHQCLFRIGNIPSDDQSNIMKEKMDRNDILKLNIMYSHITVNTHSYVPIEVECSDPTAAIFENDLSENIVNVHDVLLDKFISEGKDIDGSPIIIVDSTQASLYELALAVAAGSPVLLQGPVGSGKTSLVEHLARVTGRDPYSDILKVQFGDQMDSKLLLGNYCCTEVPGEFEWHPGVVTRAMTDGLWLLLEDIDSAPMDVITTLAPIIESQSLLLPGQVTPMRAVPGFQVFATIRLSVGHDRLYSGFRTNCEKLKQLMRVITLQNLCHEELQQVIVNKWPALAPIVDRILKIYYLFSMDGKASGRKEDTPALPASITKGRLISTRDLFKFCDRIADGFNIQSSETSLIAFQHALDCFCASFPLVSNRIAAAECIGVHFNIPRSKAEYYCTKHKPNVEVYTQKVQIGRAVMPVQPSVPSLIPQPVPSFAYTRQAAYLLERVLVSVSRNEPILLVGETGTGKTSIVQFLANRTNNKLTVINMNQQSDSVDLIGGYKPVDMKIIVAPLRELFSELFPLTFSAKENSKFLGHVTKCFLSNRWHDLFELMINTQKAAMKKFSKKIKLASSEIVISKKWKKLGKRLCQLKLQVSKPAIAFSFIEGALVKAMKNGEWLLLDEINLAEAETLQCLSSVLESSGNSLYLLEKGDITPVERHPDFRMFACMNPATDIGKRDLPTGMRNRFAEFFVEELEQKEELLILVKSYLSCLAVDTSIIENCVDFYLYMRKDLSKKLSDGTGHTPHYSLRTLCRALTCAARNSFGSLYRSLFEGFALSFLSQVDLSSHELVYNALKDFLLGKSHLPVLTQKIPEPHGNTNVNVQGFWVPIGNKEIHPPENYVLTTSVRRNLQNLARIVSAGNYPVLLQGETSVGKTSLVQYLAQITGNHCVRVNNHEHTDIEEYVGSHCVDNKSISGNFVFKEGILAQAMRKGYWIILDELNLAPTEVMEALNRVLDDNRELFIAETQQVIKAHPKFRVFATQNPPGQYGGRKILSRAFRNRFIELYFDEIPIPELKIILSERCAVPPSYAERMVFVMQDLQLHRSQSGIFRGKQGFITLRDLFRWGERYRLSSLDSNTSHDWSQLLADEGYMLLAGRVRQDEEGHVIQQSIQKHMKRTVDPDRLFSFDISNPSTADIVQPILSARMSDQFKHVVFTPKMRRMAILLGKALKFKEPVLLVGNTGCGKTTMCQIFAELGRKYLNIINCHMHSESADFLGSMRPCRDVDKRVDIPLEWVNGPLVNAMKFGSYFLADEISLADDSVLERLNSVLEPQRELRLTEGSCDDESDYDGTLISAKEDFRIMATMNPGGDYGKKELSPALRNRFTEIWCPSDVTNDEFLSIIERNIAQDVLLDSSLGGSGFGQAIVDFLNWFQKSGLGKKTTVSIRDILTWVNFINKTTVAPNRDGCLSPCEAFVHGACLVFLDSLGSSAWGALNTSGIRRIKKEIHRYLKQQIDRFGNEKDLTILKEGLYSSWSSYCYKEKRKSGVPSFGFGPFLIPTREDCEINTPDGYNLDAETTKGNAVRVLRAMQLQKPILLEGSPGVGKTSLVATLANTGGFNLVRINLSEHTDISDLFGKDLPVDNSQAGEFAWRCGPLLAGLKTGSWILLDEINLASQSVLEGLNACLDHRGEIYVPELDETFKIDYPSTTRIFACQNPFRHGGSRKALPQSFLNRFTQVYMEPLSKADLKLIVTYMYPSIPSVLIAEMISFNEMMSRSLNDGSGTSSMWACNLRDIFRWCDLMISDQFEDRYNPAAHVGLIYADRMRTFEEKKKVYKMRQKHFGMTDDSLTHHLDLHVSDTLVQIGSSFLPRKGATLQKGQQLYPLHCLLPYMESLMKCIEKSWLSILVGPSSSGKTAMARLLSSLTGNPLKIIHVNSEMDTMDLLGGFEQVDLCREIEEVIEDLEPLFQKVFSVCLAKEDCGSHITNFLRHLYHIRKSDFWDKERLMTKISHFIYNLSEEFHEPISRLKSKMDWKRLRYSMSNNTGSFQWVDSLLVKAVKEGYWVLIEDVNLCSPSVLDRLNSLFEPEGLLAMSEQGIEILNPDLEELCVRTIKPHPDFRIIFTMDPKNGEISPAMRNRGVEIAIPVEITAFGQKEVTVKEWDISSIMESKHIADPHVMFCLSKIFRLLKTRALDEGPFAHHFHMASTICLQLLQKGKSLQSALFDGYDMAFIRSISSQKDRKKIFTFLRDMLNKDLGKPWEPLFYHRQLPLVPPSNVDYQHSCISSNLLQHASLISYLMRTFLNGLLGFSDQANVILPPGPAFKLPPVTESRKWILILLTALRIFLERSSVDEWRSFCLWFDSILMDISKSLEETEAERITCFEKVFFPLRRVMECHFAGFVDATSVSDLVSTSKTIVKCLESNKSEIYINPEDIPIDPRWNSCLFQKLMLEFHKVPENRNFDVEELTENLYSAANRLLLSFILETAHSASIITMEEIQNSEEGLTCLYEIGEKCNKGLVPVARLLHPGVAHIPEFLSKLHATLAKGVRNCTNEYFWPGWNVIKVFQQFTQFCRKPIADAPPSELANVFSLHVARMIKKLTNESLFNISEDTENIIALLVSCLGLENMEVQKLRSKAVSRFGCPPAFCSENIAKVFTDVVEIHDKVNIYKMMRSNNNSMDDLKVVVGNGQKWYHAMVSAIEGSVARSNTDKQRFCDVISSIHEIQLQLRDLGFMADNDDDDIMEVCQQPAAMVNINENQLTLNIQLLPFWEYFFLHAEGIFLNGTAKSIKSGTPSGASHHKRYEKFIGDLGINKLNYDPVHIGQLLTLQKNEKVLFPACLATFLHCLQNSPLCGEQTLCFNWGKKDTDKKLEEPDVKITWDKQSPLLTMSCVRLFMNTNCTDPDALPLKNFASKKQQIEVLKGVLWRSRESLGRYGFWPNLATILVRYFDYLVAMMSSFVKVGGSRDMTEILERIWSELKLSTILKYGNTNMLVDARDCVLDMRTAINSGDRDFMDVNWSIGMSFAKVGVLMSVLFAPIYSHDPVQKYHLAYSCCNNLLQDCLMEFHFHDWLSTANGGQSLQDVQNDVHPFILGLSSTITKLREKSEKIKSKLSYRPSPSQYAHLVNDVKQFLSAFGSPFSAHELVNTMQALRDESQDKMLSDTMLQKTLQSVKTYVSVVKSFVTTLTSKFPFYRDLLFPFVTGIEMISMGIQMLSRYLSVTALRQKSPDMKNAENVLIRVCSFPSVTETDIAVTPFQLASSLGNTETLQCVTSMRESVNLGRNDGCLAKLLRSALMEITNEVVILKSTPPSHILNVAESILMCFYRALEKQNEEEKKRKIEEESLYEQRIQTFGEEMSEEELLAKNLKSSFPTYDKEFSDLIEGSLDMYVEEEESSTEKVEIELDIKPEDIMKVWSCHATLIANTPPFESENHLPSPVTKLVDQADFCTPFLIRYDVMKRLLPALNDIDSSVDSHLVGGHLVAGSFLQLQGDIQSSSRSINEDVFYDIYHDSNPNEALQLILVLDALVVHVNLILKDFPENPLLLQLLRVLERIQSFPVTSPVMKFVSGLEMVLEAAQAWEQVAHKGNSLKIELDAITRKVLYFRQLENKCLSLCLEHILKREYENCAKWWFHIYSIAFVEKEERMTDILGTLQQFVEDSTLGQFKPKMELLHTFVRHLTFTANTEYKKNVRDIMLNIYLFYKQFLSVISDRIDTMKAPLEKEVADFVKIAKWNEANFFSVKKSVEKTHQTINKCMHKFQVALQQPVRSFFQLVDKEVVISQHLTHPLDILDESSIKLIQNPEGKIPSLVNDEFFDEIPAYYRKSKKLCRKTLKNFSLTEDILAVDSFTASIIGKLQHIKSLEIKRGGDIKAEMKHFNHNVQLKKKALSDVLKDLKIVGLSYRKGLIYFDKRNVVDELNPMLIPGISSLIWKRLEKSLRFEAVNLCTLWDETNIAFYKCIAQFAVLESWLLAQNKKLRDGETLRKFKGYSAHTLQNVVHHRRHFSSEAPAIADLSEAVESLATIITGIEQQDTENTEGLYFPPQDFVAMWKGELSNFLVQTSAALHQFDTLLRCCPQTTEEHNISLHPHSSSVLSGFIKGDKLWTELVFDVQSGMDKVKDLIASTQLILKEECELHTWLHFCQIKENFKCLTDLVEKFARSHCLHFRAMSRSEDMGTNFTSSFFNLYISIKTHWNRFSNEFGKFYQNASSEVTEKEQEVASLAEKLLRKLLKTIENIHTYGLEYSSSIDNEDGSQSDLYTKRFCGNMEMFSQSLNVPVILGMVKKIMCKMSFFETSSEKLPILERYILSLVPLLQQYLKFVRLYFSTCILGQQVSCKLMASMLQLFTEFIENGFGDPPQESSGKDSGATEFHDIQQGGLGDGEGTKDVSKDIESEDQLEGAQLPGAEKKEDNPTDIKEEDDGIEMSEDFEGKAYDPVEGEENEDKEEQEIDEDELEKKMGDVDDAEADKLDEQLWADENEDEDELGEDECGKGTAQEQTSELVAKDSTEKEDDPSKNSGATDKCPDLKNEGEYDGEHEDPLIDAPPLLEPEVIDLPEKMQLDHKDDDVDEDEDTEGNDMDIDIAKDEGEDEEATKDYEDLEEPLEKPDTDLKDQSDIEIESDIEKGVPEEILADDPSSKNTEEPEQKTDNVGLPSEHTPMPSGDKVEASGKKEGSSQDMVQGQDDEEIDVWEGGAQDKEGQQQEGQATDSESKSLDAGGKGEKRATPSDAEDSASQSKKMRRADEDRTLGDVNQDSYKRLDVKEPSSKESSEKTSGKSQEYEHVKDGKDHDQQAMDAATREQVMRQPPPLHRLNPESDDDDEEEDDEDEDSDVIALDSSSDDETIASDRKAELPRGAGDAYKRNTRNATGETNDDESENHRTGKNIESYTFPQRSESTIHTEFNLYGHVAGENPEELRRRIESKIGDLKKEKLKNPNVANSLWRSIEDSISPHVQDLCEQLRLVLEPTKMAKMKGDYKTGKRLNMRKIISYIASQFRKDKIWLRRTKASKREYQIMLAVDDSYSMSDNHSKQLAYESLALLGKALSIIESGELAVVSFGEDVNVIQNFGENFSHEAGARILNSLSFEQSKTNVRQLIEYAEKAMIQARGQTSKSLAKEIAQLLIIISDGRGIYNEGEEALKLAVRRALNNNIFMVFVVLDNPTNKDSILDIQRTEFDKDRNVLLKSYLESFPFPFYVILRSIDALPHVLGEALRQWFELVTATER